MIRRTERAFRPVVEGVEKRDLATAGLMHGLVAPAAPHAGVAEWKAEAVRPLGRPGVGPGLGQGLVRLTLPYSYGAYGVVTIWNNTNTTVGFAVSASTAYNGQYGLFMLRPGQYQSYFAPVQNTQMPVFRVLLKAGDTPFVLPQDNRVFEGAGWVAPGTSGWPYAINIGVNGY